MSRGRRKKNSVSLSASSRTSSRLSLRWRYPASTSIWLAGSASEPLFGTAIRSMCTCLWKEAGARAIHLEMSVDVLERDSLAQHDHLDPVEELADLLGRAVGRLVLRRHPHLGGFLDHLLALLVDAGVQRDDRARTARTGALPLGKLGEQLVEGLHLED